MMTFTEDMKHIDEIINDKTVKYSEVDMFQSLIAEYVIKHWTEIKSRIGIG